MLHLWILKIMDLGRLKANGSCSDEYCVLYGATKTARSTWFSDYTSRKKIRITESCQERTANAFQMECLTMAAQALTKQCTKISRAMYNEPPHSWAAGVQLDLERASGRVCSGTDPHRGLLLPSYKGGKFPSTWLARLSSHHRQQSRPTVTGLETLSLRLTGRYITAKTQRDKSLCAVLKNFTSLIQKLKTSSFEKDSRFFFVLEDLRNTAKHAFQALHLVKINQLKGQILLLCSPVKPTKPH